MGAHRESDGPAVTAPLVTGTTRPSIYRGESELDGHRWRQAKNLMMTVTMSVSVVVVLVPLGFLLGYVIAEGAGIMSIDFLTNDIPIVSRSVGPGMGPAVVGTLLITGAAALMAIPLGVLGGIWLNEYGGQSTLARVVRFLSEVMTGVPSIVMGLFIFTIFVTRNGFSGFAGALALACLMLPVVLRTAEEMLRLVPSELREASYALGGRQARTIGGVILPAAAPGIVSGALLAVARAAGETAPLVVTIAAVNTINSDLFSGPNTALSAQIFRNATSAFPGPRARAWGAALTLIGIVFVFTILARLVTSVFARRAGGR